MCRGAGRSTSTWRTAPEPARRPGGQFGSLQCSAGPVLMGSCKPPPHAWRLAPCPALPLARRATPRSLAAAAGGGGPPPRRRATGSRHDGNARKQLLRFGCSVHTRGQLLTGSRRGHFLLECAGLPARHLSSSAERSQLTVGSACHRVR
jgi:hypothetical protein